MSRPSYPEEKDEAFYKLLNDDFDAAKSAAKFTLKSKTANGTKIKIDGKAGADGKSTEGSFEVKHKTKSGLEWKEKWATSNTFEAELKAKDLLTPGTEAEVKAKLPINKGFNAVEGSAALTFGREHWSLKAEFDSKTITASTALSWKNWLFGAKADVDTSFKLGNHTLAVQTNPDESSTATIYVENLEKVTGSWLHKLNKDITYGAVGSYTHSSAKTTTFDVVGKYQFDETTSLKAKLNVMSKVASLSLKQKVNAGVSFNASAVIDPNGAAPKLGLSVTLGDDN